MRQIAIIRGVRFGMDSAGRVGLSFGVFIAEGLGAPQFLDLADAAAVIASYGVGDVSRLDGKPCWVRVAGPLCSFVAPCLI